MILPEKLRDYALDPTNDDGRHKARVFRSALGIEQNDWEWLRDQILENIVHSEVTSVRRGPHGCNYAVPIRLTGLNGATHWVLTAWNIPADGDAPRLVSAYVHLGWTTR